MAVITRYYFKDVILLSASEKVKTHNYIDLEEFSGNNITGAFSNEPIIIPSLSKDYEVEIGTLTPGLSSFTVIRGKMGYQGVALVCDIEITSLESNTPVGLSSLEMAERVRLLIGEKLEYKTILLMLNNAQDETIRIFLNNNKQVLQDLNVSLTDQVLDSDGEFDLTTLDYSIFKKYKGLYSVKLIDYDYCDKISYEEFMAFENRNRIYTVSKPIYYLKGDIIHIEPNNDGGYKFDMDYIRTPNQMTIASVSENSVYCELDIELQDIIIGLACEDYIDVSTKAKGAYERAIRKINEIGEDLSSDSIPKGRYYSDNQLGAGKGFNILTGFGYS